jgi:anthranilate synthase component 1
MPEILSDFRTPIEVMRVLMNADERCFMLESADASKRWGRYTFLGYGSRMNITIKDGILNVDGRESHTSDPNGDIRSILEEYRTPKVQGMPQFTGGLVGYFSYDYLKYSEPTLDLNAKDTEGFKDADLMLFDRLIVFDNFAQKMLVIVNIPLKDPEKAYADAEEEMSPS